MKRVVFSSFYTLNHKRCSRDMSSQYHFVRISLSFVLTGLTVGHSWRGAVSLSFPPRKLNSASLPSSNMQVAFTKMHGCGNDYIYVNAIEHPLSHPSELSILWSAPHTGIGADGLVLIGKPSTANADFSMRIFNADGTEAMMCGNACRCVAKYLYDKRLTRQTMIQLETNSGIRELRLHVDNPGEAVDSVSVAMGCPVIGGVALPLSTTNATRAGTEISVGNPHLVVFVDDITTVPLEVEGPALEFYPSLTFGRTNVEFAQVLDRRCVRMRVWERGSGVTQACGTGASAVVVAAVMQNLTDRCVEVVMDGGTLTIEWEEDTNTVFMRGTAVLVFEGAIHVDAT